MAGFDSDCEVKKVYTTAMLGKNVEHSPDASYQSVDNQPQVGSRRWFLIHGTRIVTFMAAGYLISNLSPFVTELWKNWQKYKEDQDFLTSNRLGSSRSAQSIRGWAISHVSPQESDSILKNIRRITYTIPTQAYIDFSQDRRLLEVGTGIRTAVRLVTGFPFLPLQDVIPSVMVQLPVKGDLEHEELVLRMRQDPLERQAQRRVSDIIKFEKINEHGETVDIKLASLRMIRTYYDKAPMFELITFDSN